MITDVAKRSCEGSAARLYIHIYMMCTDTHMCLLLERAADHIFFKIGCIHSYFEAVEELLSLLRLK